ncbi:MAG: thymidine kinase [Clostridiales Family XIII bacterium]|jgi:thymidine kinase|nr:thymidine kinase [Clostridiales Family XIII bacterium]
MAQLFFRYSTMNAGKTLDLIKIAYNYMERGKRPLILIPHVDNRYGAGKVVSKAGAEMPALTVEDETNLLSFFIEENEKHPVDCVLIDEGQFLKKQQVLELTEIVDSLNTPVIVYGLKNDFKNDLFEGALNLLIYADKIEEIKTICWCGRKATMVARVIDGKFVRNGEQIMVGGNELYVSLCRKHYNDGRLGEEHTRPSSHLHAGAETKLYHAEE